MFTTVRLVFLTLKQEGLKSAWRRHGWTLVGLVFMYYLIRDTFLYLVLPFLAWRFLN